MEPGLLVAKDRLPDSWQRFAKSGAFTLKARGERMLLCTPIGFMWRFMKKSFQSIKLGMDLAFSTLKAVISQPMTLHGVVWQLAVAIELLMPTSPLYSVVLQKIGLQPGPRPSQLLSLCLDPHIYKKSDEEFTQKVFVVSDKAKNDMLMWDVCCFLRTLTRCDAIWK